jgi:hypothetical protein
MPNDMDTLANWEAVEFPPGNESLSEMIDRIVYGVDLRCNLDDIARQEVAPPEGFPPAAD